MAVVLKCKRLPATGCGAHACPRAKPEASPQHTPVRAPHMPVETSGPAGEFVRALDRMGLLQPGGAPRIVPLSGGVSSHIVRAELASSPVCIKRALSKLKVQADWQVPVERNRWEGASMRTAARFEHASGPIAQRLAGRAALAPRAAAPR